ncbi:MAG: hypothetical protein JWP03_3319 [Phycisphaerales bacterium]|nr:hypothetical protein [Phycisphaerales bacterium]
MMSDSQDIHPLCLHIQANGDKDIVPNSVPLTNDVEHRRASSTLPLYHHWTAGDLVDRIKDVFL